MLTFTEAQVLAWITPIVWPFIRVLALFGSLPVLSQRNVPMRVKIALAFLVAFCAQATLPTMPTIALDSAAGFMTVVQQLIIGIALGFAVRIVFSAIELAGELVGLQMGLNFSGFFNPGSGSEATPMSRFFGISVSWLFIVTGGHLMLIAAVVQSFHAFPVSPEPFAFLRSVQPQTWGREIFGLGLWIALPMIAMLLFTNIVLGVISRVAQQMNIFSIGFPITLGVGLIGVLLTLPLMQAPFTMALERMLAYFQ
ncbi:flagellar biosynthetic protein FliR [Piscinibacter koreensis]|uniref:Flagellar biosynthetic protein FliR n=1 Tax=Piscinibacter koreensis TaxID=2742824 RepID=A0A7Y6TWE1_9BURK|nr:flagellar biosynthetic protein FliR [Schlegelella koreensis]NUZ05927.1 flagellar biosynthetic protein FliR [Schlegelella koreensis]